MKGGCFNPLEEESAVCVGYSLSQRVAQEHTQVIPSLLLQKQRVSRTLNVTFPGQQSSGFAKSSAEPGLGATAASVGSTGEGTACLGGHRGTQVGHPGRQQGLSLLKGRSKIWPCVAGATSVALLFRDRCSPMKWVTNYQKLGGNLGLKHTGFCLVPRCIVSIGSLWERVLQCLPARMGTCIAESKRVEHGGSPQKVDYDGQHMRIWMYGKEGAF